MPLQDFDEVEIPFEVIISADETKLILTKNLVNIDQEQNTWCYAACAELVLRYYEKTKANGSAIHQCNIAGVIHPGAVCCNTPPDSQCTDIGCEPEDIITIYKRFGLSPVAQNTFVAFEALQKEINKGRLVEVCIQWNDSTHPLLFSAHVVIVRGWIDSSLGQFLEILDPLPSNEFGGTVSYEQLKAGFGHGAWKLTFLGFPDNAL